MKINYAVRMSGAPGGRFTHGAYDFVVRSSPTHPLPLRSRRTRADAGIGLQMRMKSRLLPVLIYGATYPLSSVNRTTSHDLVYRFLPLRRLGRISSPLFVLLLSSGEVITTVETMRFLGRAEIAMILEEVVR